MATARTLVLIDPSDPRGEDGLEMLTNDLAVTLLLALDGRSAAALHEFAKSEEIDVSMAGLIYMDQIVRRLDRRAGIRDVEAVSTTGTNTVVAIFDVMEHRCIDKVIVPSSLPGLDGRALATLAQMCPVPVVIAPGTPVGPEIAIAS
jgi:hypothetical protein